MGLTFYEDATLAKKIQSYRSRFDEKYLTNPKLHIALVPPFELSHSNLKNLEKELVEELESFYFDHDQTHALEVTGLDVYDYRKTQMLYLNPVENTDLTHTEESLTSICQTYIEEREKRIKQSKKFLTIGRFADHMSLHQGVSLAEKEFEELTPLPFQSISLFKKQNGIWYQATPLMEFKAPPQSF